MIEKVGLSYSIKFKNNQQKNNNHTVSQPKINSNSQLDLPYYYPVNFTAKQQRNVQKMTPLEVLEYYYTNSATNLVNDATKIAKENHNTEVNHFHIWKAELNQLDKYIDDLNSGSKHHSDMSGDTIQSFLETITSNSLFKDEQTRKEFQKLIKKENKTLDDIIAKFPKDEKVDNPKLSDELVRDIWSPREDENERVYDFNIFGSTFYSANENVKNFIDNFVNKTCDLTMVSNIPLDERAHIKDYDAKASNVWKNLALGTNMFVTFDHKKVNPNMFITSLYKTAPEDTDITEFNLSIKERYVFEKVKELAKDKDKKHVIIMYPSNMLVNSATQEEKENQVFSYSTEFRNLMANIPQNIKFIMIDVKDNYFLNMQNSIIQSMYENFGELSVPVLSTEQFVKAFKDVPQLMKDIKKPFSKKAIEKTVESSAQLDGVFPDKTQKLMKKMTSYYIDKKEINEKDVINYVKEAKELFKKNEDDSSINVIFDTEKRIKDIIGKDATQKEAAAIVKQIKSNKMGTKGMIIYSQDSMAGSGRRFIAKAIAGEAKVPYIEMNAMDFGTKEVDIFGGSLLSPEASIKKMFSLVNTQAESNSNNSAVLFIENFEYFSIGELISEYQQKAMAQLLREMDNAERKGLNILVIGSVSDPRLIGEATMKSFKFVDSIEVSSPAFNDKERADIIQTAIKENKIKIAGQTPVEKQEIINSIAKTTEGFPFIFVKNLVKKAQSVALERGHKEVTKGDFTEAYMQITTGRPSTKHIEQHEKDIVTSHECGHAVNAEIMNNIAKKYGKPWHKSSKVNFITLDPRGYYGGAMYPLEDNNEERSFEKLFADIVCDYGGHSCEKHFYGIDGSFGISCDLDMAADNVDKMIKIMGLGPKTGKQSLYRFGSNISEKMKEQIEDDRRIILENALTASDLITETYADFNREFTKKYSHLVGTGDCLVDGEVFRKELADWKARQPKEKQDEITLMEHIILDIMNQTKKGVIY